ESAQVVGMLRGRCRSKIAVRSGGINTAALALKPRRIKHQTLVPLSRPEPQTSSWSAENIYPRKVDELGRPTVENGLHHEHPKMIGLIQCRLGRHGKLLAGTHDVEENGPLVRERCLDGALQFVRLFNPYTADPH